MNWDLFIRSQDLTSISAVLQRVKSASVTVDKKLVSEIGKGILVFAAIAKEDTKKDMESMAAKLLKFKMWPDVEPTTENGVRKEWKKNVRDIDGEILCGESLPHVRWRGHADVVA